MSAGTPRLGEQGGLGYSPWPSLVPKMSLSGLLFVGWPTGGRGRGLGSPTWATDLSLKSELHETLSEETKVLQLGEIRWERGLPVAGGPGFDATRDWVLWHKCCSKVQRWGEHGRIPGQPLLHSGCRIK